MTTTVAPVQTYSWAKPGMIAYHGDPKIKAKYLARVRKHHKMDQLIKGRYWEDGKGCAVGCTIHSPNHAAYETELGIPRILARLEDSLFESLDNGLAQAWPERFLKAIPVGADLSLIWPKFAVWLMADPTWGVIQYTKSNASKKAIQDVATAYQSVVDGSSQHVDWPKLRRAAYAAYAADAADAAQAAVAAAYAADAAYVAYVAAADAADAAADADAAKRKEALIAQSNKLISLLETA